MSGSWSQGDWVEAWEDLLSKQLKTPPGGITGQCSDYPDNREFSDSDEESDEDDEDTETDDNDYEGGFPDEESVNI